MPRKQKEISDRYKGNRSYFRILHPLRKWRVFLVAAVVVFGLAMLLLSILGYRRIPHVEKFYNVGKLSQAHTQLTNNCQKCHTGSKEISLLPTKASEEAIQKGCESCHSGFDFHQANVVTETTCIQCHQEHLGNGAMRRVDDASCLICHGSSDLMAASSAMDTKIPARYLELSPVPGICFFPEPRMPGGYTEVIHAFDKDHPSFRIQRDPIPETTVTELNRFKFSHLAHLSGTIPKVNGQDLDCSYCHKLDSSRTYMKQVSYEESCSACHSLQLDVNMAGLQIPHPATSSATVVDFIRNLPMQIQKYGRDQGITDSNKLKDFVSSNMSAIQTRARRGDDLMHDVFFAENARASFGGSGGDDKDAPYPGCAYCHTAGIASNGSPTVLKELVPDRWMGMANFNHGKHSTMSCLQCHEGAKGSQKSSDIILPTQASCVTCHSAKGGVSSACVSCHSYHHSAPNGYEPPSDTPVRDMLEGK